MDAQTQQVPGLETVSPVPSEGMSQVQTDKLGTEQKLAGEVKPQAQSPLSGTETAATKPLDVSSEEKLVEPATDSLVQKTNLS